MDPTNRDTDGRSGARPTPPPDRRALITGGAGFVGVNTAVHLIKEGWAVTLLDNLSRPGTERNLRWIITRHPTRVTFVKEDVRNHDALAQHVRGQDAIVHLAAQTGVGASIDDPAGDFEINARGTLNVLEAVRLHNHDAAVVFTSTSRVYGALERGNPCKETQPLDLHSPYVCSKGAADQYVHDYARVFDMNTVVLRPGSIYGAHQYGGEDDAWVAHLAHSILDERQVTIHGDGTQLRDLLEVRDLAAFCATVVDKIGIARGEVYNAGGGSENQRTMLEVVEQIGEVTGRKPRYDFAEAREDDARYCVTDIEKARRDLGWEPKVEFNRGLRELLAWVESTR